MLTTQVQLPQRIPRFFRSVTGLHGMGFMAGAGKTVRDAGSAGGRPRRAFPVPAGLRLHGPPLRDPWGVLAAGMCRIMVTILWATTMVAGPCLSACLRRADAYAASVPASCRTAASAAPRMARLARLPGPVFLILPACGRFPGRQAAGHGPAHDAACLGPLDPGGVPIPGAVGTAASAPAPAVPAGSLASPLWAAPVPGSPPPPRHGDLPRQVPRLPGAPARDRPVVPGARPRGLRLPQGPFGVHGGGARLDAVAAREAAGAACRARPVPGRPRPLPGHRAHPPGVARGDAAPRHHARPRHLRHLPCANPVGLLGGPGHQGRPVRVGQSGAGPGRPGGARRPVPHAASRPAGGPAGAAAQAPARHRPSELRRAVPGVGVPPPPGNLPVPARHARAALSLHHACPHACLSRPFLSPPSGCLADRKPRTPIRARSPVTRRPGLPHSTERAPGPRATGGRSIGATTPGWLSCVQQTNQQVKVLKAEKLAGRVLRLSDTSLLRLWHKACSLRRSPMRPNACFRGPAGRRDGAGPHVPPPPGGLRVPPCLAGPRAGARFRAAGSRPAAYGAGPRPISMGCVEPGSGAIARNVPRTPVAGSGGDVAA